MSLRVLPVLPVCALLLLTAGACFPADDGGKNDGGTSDAATGDAGPDGGSDGGGGLCSPGSQASCSCAAGNPGQKTCLPSGAAYAACICGTSCPSGEHDGGDGVCQPSGQCSVGFHDGGDGSCVTLASCAPTYHDGGDGSCVPDGLCQAGFHDGGDGSCRPEGQCSPDYGLGTNGSCQVVKPCALGLDLAPSELNFGAVPVGQQAAFNLTLRNLDLAAACTISSLQLARGTDAAFSISGGPQQNITLLAGASLVVELVFAPSLTGAASGFVSVTLESGGVQTLRLRGQGLDLALQAEPVSYDFGTLAFPCATGLTNLCVHNTGSVNVQVTGMQLSGSNELHLISAPPTPFALLAGDSYCVGVQYVPAAPGPIQGALELQLSPGTNLLTIPITGAAATGMATDSFVQSAAPKADILWVMDNSCSMYEEQIGLQSAAASLRSVLNTYNVDYHLAVTSTDVQAAPPNGQGTMAPFDRSRPYVVTQSTPDPAGTFGQNVLLGTNGSATEEGFEGARMALSSPMIDDSSLPINNTGFLRPDAILSTIFVSDEPEQSPDTESVYLSFFRGIHGASRPDLFVASAFVGPPGGCTGPGGSAAAGPRYWGMAAQTGGAQQSICQPDWTLALDALVSSFTLVSRFVLGNPAAGSTGMEVWIVATDGSRSQATGWSYDAGANAVDFGAGSVPQPGESIEVTYPTACP